MVTAVSASVRLVVSENRADELPAGTRTACGTPTTALVLRRLTEVPPAGAAEERETVHCVPAPATRVLTSQANEVRRPGAEIVT